MLNKLFIFNILFNNKTPRFSKSQNIISLSEYINTNLMNVFKVYNVFHHFNHNDIEMTFDLKLWPLDFQLVLLFSLLFHPGVVKHLRYFLSFLACVRWETDRQTPSCTSVVPAQSCVSWPHHVARFLGSVLFSPVRWDLVQPLGHKWRSFVGVHYGFAVEKKHHLNIRHNFYVIDG